MDNAGKLIAGLTPEAPVAVTAVAVTAGWQNPNPYPVTVSIPAATAGTVEIQVSADGTTYTTLEAARTVPVSDGPNIAVVLRPGMYVKLTATTSVLANGFVY